MNDFDVDQFEAYRPLMFSIAYRMLGSATEAEDIVQEAFLRYQTSTTENIKSHKALLSTVVTRLSLDHLKSAQAQRETYVGTWLPEPMLTEGRKDITPSKHVEVYDSISIAFLTLLEELTPLERAVFLLREVFDYEYSEIALTVNREETACRQLFSRAKKHIAEHRQRFIPSKEDHRRILEQFIQATRTGDVDGLIDVLSEDVVFWSDGGGKTRGAALHPILGRHAVAQFVLGSTRLQMGNYDVAVSEVNNEFAAVIRGGNRTIAVITIVIDKGQISQIRAIGNPEKLKWVHGHDNESDEVKE